MKNTREEISWGEPGFDPFYQEQIKALRSKVIHSIDTSGDKIIGISSATPEDGKTTICLNLATAMAAVIDKRIIVIDCDLRKCDLTLNLGFYGKLGLSEFLMGKDTNITSIIYNSKIKNLHVIASGKKNYSPSELLMKGIFINLLQFLKQRYDVILIDLPPIMSTADPVTVKQAVDKYILVYHSGKTPLKLFESSIKEIGKEKILGAILNGVDVEKIMKYKKYYHSYY